MDDREIAGIAAKLEAIGARVEQTFAVVESMRGEVQAVALRVAVLDDHDGRHRESIQGLGARVGDVESRLAGIQGEERGRVSSRVMITWVLGSIAGTGGALFAIQKLIGG